jgi:hypothetical protein
MRPVGNDELFSKLNVCGRAILVPQGLKHSISGLSNQRVCGSPSISPSAGLRGSPFGPEKGHDEGHLSLALQHATYD